MQSAKRASHHGLQRPDRATGSAASYTTRKGRTCCSGTAQIPGSVTPARPRTSAAPSDVVSKTAMGRRRRITGFRAAWICAITGAICVTASGFQAPARTQFRPAGGTSPAGELVSRYCVACHNQKLKTGNLALDEIDAEHVSNAAETWEKVILKLRSRSMPPSGIRRPDNAAYDTVAEWLETEIDRAASARVNPGRSAGLHRLNRTEYANVVRDLIGIDVDAAAILPPDEQAYGFDTNADALSM